MQKQENKIAHVEIQNDLHVMQVHENVPRFIVTDCGNVFRRRRLRAASFCCEER